MAKVDILFLSFLAFHLGHAAASETRAATSTNNIPGGSAAITCSWNTSANEVLLEVQISLLSTYTDKNFIFEVSSTGWAAPGKNNFTRFSMDKVVMAKRSVTMRIRDLQRSDERVYYCIYKLGVQGSQTVFNSNSAWLVLYAATSTDESQFAITEGFKFGENFLFQCTSAERAHETVDRFIFSKLPLNAPTDFLLSYTNSGVKEFGNQHHSRIFGVFEKGHAGFLVVTVTCSDVASYRCDILYKNYGRLRMETYERRIVNRATPRVINITYDSNSRVENKYWRAYDVVFSCLANVGPAGRGRIVWRVYHHCGYELITENDDRILSYENVSYLPRTNIADPCTVRMEQRVQIRFYQGNANLKVACFVKSTYDLSEFPIYCDDPSSQACMKTEGIVINPVENTTSRGPVEATTATRDVQRTSAMMFILLITVIVGIIFGMAVGVAWSITARWKKRPAVRSKPEQIKIEEVKSDTVVEKTE